MAVGGGAWRGWLQAHRRAVVVVLVVPATVRLPSRGHTCVPDVCHRKPELLGRVTCRQGRQMVLRSTDSARTDRASSPANPSRGLGTGSSEPLDALVQAEWRTGHVNVNDGSQCTRRRRVGRHDRSGPGMSDLSCSSSFLAPCDASHRCPPVCSCRTHCGTFPGQSLARRVRGPRLARRVRAPFRNVRRHPAGRLH